MFTIRTSFLDNFWTYGGEGETQYVHWFSYQGFVDMVHPPDLVLRAQTTLWRQLLYRTTLGDYISQDAFPWTAYLGSLLVSLCADSQQPPEQEVGDLELGEDLGQGAHCTQHLTHHTIRSAECGVDLGAHA